MNKQKNKLCRKIVKCYARRKNSAVRIEQLCKELKLFH